MTISTVIENAQNALLASTANLAKSRDLTTRKVDAHNAKIAKLAAKAEKAKLALFAAEAALLAAIDAEADILADRERVDAKKAATVTKRQDDLAAKVAREAARDAKVAHRAREAAVVAGELQPNATTGERHAMATGEIEMGKMIDLFGSKQAVLQALSDLQNAG